MASVTIGKFAQEYSSFGSPIDLNATAGPCRLIQILTSGSGGLVLVTAENRTVTLSGLVAGDTVTSGAAGFMSITSGTVGSVRAVWS